MGHTIGPSGLGVSPLSPPTGRSGPTQPAPPRPRGFRDQNMLRPRPRGPTAALMDALRCLSTDKSQHRTGDILGPSLLTEHSDPCCSNRGTLLRLRCNAIMAPVSRCHHPGLTEHGAGIRTRLLYRTWRHVPPPRPTGLDGQEEDRTAAPPQQALTEVTGRP